MLSGLKALSTKIRDFTAILNAVPEFIGFLNTVISFMWSNFFKFSQFIISSNMYFLVTCFFLFQILKKFHYTYWVNRIHVIDHPRHPVLMSTACISYYYYKNFFCCSYLFKKYKQVKERDGNLSMWIIYQVLYESYLCLADGIIPWWNSFFFFFIVTCEFGFESDITRYKKEFICVIWFYHAIETKLNTFQRY